MKIHKGDLVQMMVGKDAGKQAKILRVQKESGKVLVEGLNMLKRNKKARAQGGKGEIVSAPRFVAAANVMVICPKCGKPSRMGSVGAGEKKARMCKKCKAAI
ncbi:MAG: 50S ribosomal protein L24 [Candidatus Pacebacteria bacterium]|nr:50S ribosomal protein L24 [Candidatus Paceibacterota bacterium]